MLLRAGLRRREGGRAGRVLCVVLLAAGAAACGGEDTATGPTSPALPPRTYGMGFSPIPPRFDQALVVPNVDLWSRRADTGLVLQEPPWAELLAGQDPEALVRAGPLPLAEYYRSKGLRVVASIDPANGLDRSAEGNALVAAGRSLGEPAVRDLYTRYVGAFVSLVRPEIVTLASETNLIRALSPPRIYEAVVAAANEAAAEARRRAPAVRLLITVQVELANAPAAAASPDPTAQDRADFPFLEALGLSSYPYLAGVGAPEDLALDYYTRAVRGTTLPVYFIEGGWPSDPALASSLDEQRRYVERQAALLDAVRAQGWYHLTFTDLDLSAFPPAIVPFASLGFVDASFAPKPSLLAWDAVFARPRRP